MPISRVMKNTKFLSVALGLAFQLGILFPSYADDPCGAHFKVDPKQVAALQKLLMDEVLQHPEKLAALEGKLISEIQKLSNAKALKPILTQVAHKLKGMNKLPDRITDENIGQMIDRLTDMIDGEFRAHGMTPESKGVVYRSWEEVSNEQLAAARKTKVPAAGPGNPSAFYNSKFISELEKVSESRFTGAEAAKPLIDGPESFPLREKLIRNAKTSIHIMSWAIEDDVTGWKFANLLIQKAKDIDVKIMVDHKTAQMDPYKKMVEYLEKNGVQTIRWKDPKFPYYGLHRKIMIVDGEEVIGGGMNFGDVYSHLGPEKTAKWRDTDAYFQGDIAKEAAYLFATQWNKNVNRNQLSFPKLKVPNKPDYSRIPAGNVKVMLVDQEPSPQTIDPVMRAVLKGIEGATTSVDIENAYFISTPAIKDAILAAAKRGVKIRLFTNSGESVDVPIISAPILKSLPDLIAAGVEVHVKTGPTLHSKYLVIDGFASYVMSYNFHPQSVRTQCENAFIVLDARFASDLTAAYENGIRNQGRRVLSATDIPVKDSPINFLINRYFFDQL
ncbi:MAG: phosphatidylserine/phosphatidylglycerophosphate/cardiolipin synthase family protein [Bdellovibrionales bacterium]|nr:phosphatidylserine/phosphatidylglycerophosphate/cardiolipin synthase family protein [Bdellovibrionales bacterium]